MLPWLTEEETDALLREFNINNNNKNSGGGGGDAELAANGARNPQSKSGVSVVGAAVTIM